MAEVIAKYFVRSSIPLEEAGKKIAEEESTGTWTAVSTTSRMIEKKCSAHVGSIDEENKTVEVIYPAVDFDIEVGGIPNVLSIVAGNLFGLEALKGVRLLDVQFPKEFIKKLKGPNLGIDGVRKILGTAKSGRPHLGTIIKPKIGLSPKQTAEVAYEAALGGVDFIKDDETLTSQKFCPLEKRVTAVMKRLREVERDTGRKVLYACNVTSSDVVSTAERAIDAGANCLMVDAIVTGFDSLQALSKQFKKIPIHVHRTMHGAIDRSHDYGIDMLVLAKLARLSGADQLHIGTFGIGKMHGSSSRDYEFQNALICRWYGIKPTFPVCSGGLHPGMIPELIAVAGPNILIQMGGGIHGHPFGTRAGAKAAKQAIDACIEGSTLEDYAKDHVELLKALEKWSQ